MLPVRHDLVVHGHPEPVRVREGGLQQTDRVADPAQPLLPAGAVARRVGTDAEVDVVHHQVIGVIDDQIQVARVPGHDDPGGLLDVQRDLRAAREVVAGAQREQSEHGVGELVALVEPGHGQVQTPVAAGHHQGASPAAVQRGVQRTVLTGLDDLHVRAPPEYGEGAVQVVLVG